MDNQKARKVLKDILEVVNKRDCCDVEIDVFREEAIKTGISALGAIDQFRWERDVAIKQLEELGLGLGQRTDSIKKLIDKEILIDAIYKDGTFVCPICKASTFPLALYGGEYCQHCGQHINWKEIIKRRP